MTSSGVESKSAKSCTEGKRRRNRIMKKEMYYYILSSCCGNRASTETVMMWPLLQSSCSARELIQLLLFKSAINACALGDAVPLV